MLNTSQMREKDFRKEIAKLNEHYNKKIGEIRTEHNLAVNKLEGKHREELDKINIARRLENTKAQVNHRNELQGLARSAKEERQDIIDGYEARIKNYEETIAGLNRHWEEKLAMKRSVESPSKA